MYDDDKDEGGPHAGQVDSRGPFTSSRREPLFQRRPCCMYATPSDAGNYQFAWPEWVDHGYFNWTTGESNTLGMAQYGGYIAPAYCANLVAHGKSDWYLPAPYEMSVLRINAGSIGGFNTNPNVAYWTAAEDGDNRAWYHRMDGVTGYTAKGLGMLIRCVRKD